MKTRHHVPDSEEPCTPCKLLPARKILQLQREHNPGQGTASTNEVRFSDLENSFSRKLENAAN